MASPTPAQRVFQTAELLEQILLYVEDRKTILLSQRVAKFFNNTISGSSKLQRLLRFTYSEDDIADDLECHIDALFAGRLFQARLESYESPAITWNPHKSLSPGSWQRLRILHATKNFSETDCEIKVYFGLIRPAKLCFGIGKNWTMGQVMEKLKSIVSHIRRTGGAPQGCASLTNGSWNTKELVTEILYSLEEI